MTAFSRLPLPTGVTLSRSEGSISLSNETLPPIVTLSRSEGSVSLSLEMLRSPQHDRANLLPRLRHLKAFRSLPLLKHLMGFSLVDAY